MLYGTSHWSTRELKLNSLCWKAAFGNHQPAGKKECVSVFVGLFLSLGDRVIAYVALCVCVRERVRKGWWAQQGGGSRKERARGRGVTGWRGPLLSGPGGVGVGRGADCGPVWLQSAACVRSSRKGSPWALANPPPPHSSSSPPSLPSLPCFCPCRGQTRCVCFFFLITLLLPTCTRQVLYSTYISPRVSISFLFSCSLLPSFLPLPHLRSCSPVFVVFVCAAVPRL